MARTKALDWFALGTTLKDLAEGLWPQVTAPEETPLTLVKASDQNELHEADAELGVEMGGYCIPSELAGWFISWNIPSFEMDDD